MREKITALLADGQWHDILSDTAIDKLGLNLVNTARAIVTVGFMNEQGLVEVDITDTEPAHCWARLVSEGA